MEATSAAKHIKSTKAKEHTTHLAFMFFSAFLHKQMKHRFSSQIRTAIETPHHNFISFSQRTLSARAPFSFIAAI